MSGDIAEKLNELHHVARYAAGILDALESPPHNVSVENSGDDGPVVSCWWRAGSVKVSFMTHSVSIFWRLRDSGYEHSMNLENTDMVEIAESIKTALL
jgi:hypothetical protein